MMCGRHCCDASIARAGARVQEDDLSSQSSLEDDEEVDEGGRRAGDGVEEEVTPSKSCSETCRETGQQDACGWHCDGFRLRIEG